MRAFGGVLGGFERRSQGVESSLRYLNGQRVPPNAISINCQNVESHGINGLGAP